MRHLLGALVAPIGAAVFVATRVVDVPVARAALRPLGGPLGFVLAAVPLAVLLGELGLFERLAGKLGGPVRPGRLWVLAAALTAFVNLDAAVVLLTPLYVAVARAARRPVLELAVQPLLLSAFASLPLPYSNLTNLLVVARTGTDASTLLGTLGLPFLGACGAGFLAYRLVCNTFAGLGVDLEAGRPPPRALGATSGTAAVVLLAATVLGLALTPVDHLEPLVVVLAADAVAVGLVRRVPWRSVPAGLAIATCGIAVLVAGLATRVDLAVALGGAGGPGVWRTVGVVSGASALANNLPVTLAAAPLLATRPPVELGAVLIGTNVGSLLLPSGSLAALLWLAIVRELRIRVRVARLWLVLAPVTLAALAAATALVLASASR